MARAVHQCAVKFTGRPRDIDFIAKSNWVQVILGDATTTDLISETPNPQLTSLLEVAFSLKIVASVDYKDGATPTAPKRLTCAQIDLKRPHQKGEVLTLSFDEADGTCHATIIDDTAQAVEVNTKDARAQGILETAARLKIPTMELSYDPVTHKINRVKVNLP
jgi:hypothetical protein